MDRPGMLTEATNQLSGGDAPNTNRVIDPRRNKCLAVGQQLDSLNTARVPAELLHAVRRIRQVPQPDFTIDAGRQQPVVVNPTPRRELSLHVR